MDLVAIATLGEIKEANVSLCKLYALAKQLRMQVLDSYLFAFSSSSLSFVANLREAFDKSIFRLRHMPKCIH